MNKMKLNLNFKNTNKIVNEFTQIPLDEISSPLTKEVEDSLLLEHENYGFGNASVAFINELIHLNEINPNFSIKLFLYKEINGFQ